MGVYLYTDFVTYTVDSQYYSDTTNYVDIVKSGVNIKQVVITGSATSNDNYSGVYVGISQNTNRDYEARLAIDFGSSNTLGANIRYRTGGTNYNDYSVPASVISRTSNSYTVTFTETGWSLVLNGNSYSGTYSTGMASVVSTIMNSATCNINIAGVRVTASNQVYTVTYS